MDSSSIGWPWRLSSVPRLLKMVRKESSHQHSHLEASRTFTLFPDLPIEIRRMIWRIHLQSGRELLLRGFSMLHGEGPQPRRAPEDLELHTFAPRCRQSALLSVNFESRKEALELHHAFGSDVSQVTLALQILGRHRAKTVVVEPKDPESYYNPTADTFIVDGSHPQFWFPKPDITLPTYPTTPMFQEIESLVYVNLRFFHGRFAEVICEGKQTEDRGVVFHRHLRAVPWSRFRKLKHLVIWGSVAKTVIEDFRRAGKDILVEMRRVLDDAFKTLKIGDPFRSVPKITLHVGFEEEGQIGHYRYAGENTLEYYVWK